MSNYQLLKWASAPWRWGQCLKGKVKIRNFVFELAGIANTQTRCGESVSSSLTYDLYILAL